jgi:hypothetical protein
MLLPSAAPVPATDRVCRLYDVTARRHDSGYNLVDECKLLSIHVDGYIEPPEPEKPARCHKRVTKAAERVASITDGEVQIPAYIPAPAPTVADTIVIRAPQIDGGYRESKGHGPSGGLPLKGPGSNVDPDWINS